MGASSPALPGDLRRAGTGFAILVRDSVHRNQDVRLQAERSAGARARGPLKTVGSTTFRSGRRAADQSTAHAQAWAEYGAPEYLYRGLSNHADGIFDRYSGKQVQDGVRSQLLDVIRLGSPVQDDAIRILGDVQIADLAIRQRVNPPREFAISLASRRLQLTEIKFRDRHF